MIGLTFGRWTVISPADPLNGARVWQRWLCRCECGTERAVIAKSLKNGLSQSCGCLNRERSRERHTRHGRYATPEYKIWQAIVARCRNPKNPRYADYGARGIKLCAEWEDFAAFHREVGDRPTPRHSIDRMNNERGYEPGNCKWSLPHEQMTNRRCTRFVNVDGEKVPLATLAKKYSIPANTLRGRILKGWPVAKALTTPVRSKVFLN